MADAAPSPLHDVLYRLRAEIPGFAWAQIVNTLTGEPMVGGAVDPDVDGAVAAGAYAQVIRSNGEALDHLGIGADAADDLLVSLGEGYVLLRVLDATHFLGVAVTRQGTPGYARVVVRKYEPQLVAALGDLVASVSV